LAKKKLFGLLEDTRDDTQPQLSRFDMPVLEGPPPVNVREIYEKAGITDTNSIFKVCDLKASLPQEIPSAQAKQTVLNIMKTMGVDLAAALLDADTRISALIGMQDVTCSAMKHTIDENLQEIEKLQEQIDALKEENMEAEKSCEVLQKAVDSEVVKIKEIVAFIK
jgi:uncharacterized coiled-coil protein SlyX